MLDKPHSFSLNFLKNPVASDRVPEELWRSIFLFNLYRLVLACLSILLAVTFDDVLSLGSSNQPLFFHTSIAYVLLVLTAQLAIKFRQPRLTLLLAFQIGTDIVCLTMLSHASGGITSGLGVLLLVSLAAAGLITRGRITYLFAALASIAILLQHAYAVLTQDSAIAQFLQTGLLSVAYFVIAWVAHTLAQYATNSEKLAALRGVDLANMAEANRLVIQDMPDGVLVVDRSSVVRQCNPSAERLLEFTFPPAGTVMLFECAPQLAEQFTSWRQNPGHKPAALRLPGTHHQTRVRFLPIQHDEFWGAVIFLEDMQRVQAQAQQIKLAALGRLTANIAHEVRNPLSAVSYATELLQEEMHDPAQARLFKIILDNAARLNNIVQDVMQLNQRDRVNREKINLAEKLPLFIENLHFTENVPQEILSLDMTSVCAVNFDRGHLDQVLWNLCRNALRYCQKKNQSVKLKVRTSKEAGVILEIINDGPVIPPDVLQKLFEPFFTTSVGGTGLGLYIARELCEANGAVLEYLTLVTGEVCFRILFGDQNER